MVAALAALVGLLSFTACASGDSGDSGDNAGDAGSAVDDGTTDSGDNGGGPAGPTPGVTDTSILFGQSAALAGPTSGLGLGMQLGIEAAFAQVNEAGGVHGRTLALNSLDDGYEPDTSLSNTIQLIDEGVFALIGATGTPTSEVTAPAAQERGVPFIGPFTGADLLRDGRLENVINFRASYLEEVQAMVEYLHDELGLIRIGVLVQDDAFGRDVYHSVVATLAERDLELIAVNFYTRNTTAVRNSLLQFIGARPQAIIIISSAAPAIELLAWANDFEHDPVFIALSFVGANTLANELGEVAQGVLVSQVVPNPLDASNPLVASYHEALELYDPQASPGFVSLEGYIAGRLAIAGLELCGREVTRECFSDSILTADAIDLDGFVLGYNDDEAPDSTLVVDNQGSDQIFLTEIQGDGTFQLVNTGDKAN